MKLLKNAKIFTMENEVIENGYVIIKEDKIFSVGSMDELKTEDTFSYVYDVKGDMLLPGFVDAHSHIGLFEEGVGDTSGLLGRCHQRCR